MALVLGKFNNGATRQKLSAVPSTPGSLAGKQYRQFVLWADPDNTGTVYLGGVTVTGVPANEFMKLKAGASINLGPDGSDRPFVVDTDSIYVVGSGVSQILWIIAQHDDGRR